MERFYDNDPDKEKEPFFGSDDDDEDGEELEGEVTAFIDQQGIIDVMHMDLAQTELNQQLLSKAVEIASQSWFWRFKSTETRMNEIETIYKRLIRLTEEPEEEEENEEEEE